MTRSICLTLAIGFLSSLPLFSASSLAEESVAKESAAKDRSDHSAVQVVTVTDMAGLVRAIRPNVEIHLAKGEYSVWGIRVEPNPYVFMIEKAYLYDERLPELRIQNVKNLTIVGSGDRESIIHASSGDKTALSITGSEDVRLRNVRVGHPPGQNRRSVLVDISNSSQITLDNVEVRGESGDGIGLRKASAVAMKNTVIKGFSSGAIEVYTGTTAVLEGCSIKENGRPLYVSESSSVTIRDCLIAENSPTHSVFEVDESSKVIIERSRILNNGQVEFLAYDSKRVSIKESSIVLSGKYRYGSDNPLSPQLLLLESFHGSDLLAQTGDKYFALVRSKNKDIVEYLLKPTTLVISNFFDPIEDPDGAVPGSGKRVSVNIEEKPIVLLAGIPALREGPLETALWYSETGDIDHSGGILSPGRLTCSNFKGRNFCLVATAKVELLEGSQNQGGECLRSSDYSINLVMEGDSTHPREIKRIKDIYRTKFDFCPLFGSEDSYPKLLWAGDIDRDGALDLVLDESYVTDGIFTITRISLFLSSFAAPDNTPTIAASFSNHMGC